jgi:hypothetical protein
VAKYDVKTIHLLRDYYNSLDEDKDGVVHRNEILQAQEKNEHKQDLGYSYFFFSPTFFGILSYNWILLEIQNTGSV